MNIIGILPTFAIACFGGMAVELLKWYNLRESSNFPIYGKSPVYWALTGLMIVAGGGLALLYGVESKNALLVANIGASAPLIIKAFAETTPRPSTTVTDSGPATPGFGFDNRVHEAPLLALVLNFLSWR